MAGVGLLFSGQGAQYPGMGKSLYETSTAARDVLDRLQARRGDLLELCFDGSAADLAKTENTQPAVYAVDLAAAFALEEAGLRADAVAGFSLGELAALAYAGYVTPEQGFDLVQMRSAFMAQAASERPGTMLAVLRMANEEVEALCEGRELYPANYNCPGQLVVSGTVSEIEYLKEKVREAGGRSVPVAVSGGFHSPLMAGAARSMEEALENIDFRTPRMPLYSNVTGERYGEDAARLLRDQIDHPVRWEALIHNMVRQGIDGFAEAGPGRTLGGFSVRIAPGIPVYSVDSAESLEKWKEGQTHVER